MPPTQLTIRGFDRDLERRLRRLARERSLSLNKAALLLMRRGAGLAPPGGGTDAAAERIGDRLDPFVGVWSEEDEREFLDAIRSLERVDPGLWE